MISLFTLSIVTLVLNLFLGMTTPFWEIIGISDCLQQLVVKASNVIMVYIVTTANAKLQLMLIFFE